MAKRTPKSEAPSREPEPVVDEADAPLLFISHRHSDAKDVKVATAIREWAEKWALGSVSVFQSSAAGVAPRIGANLNEQLAGRLSKAQSVVLVYTASDHDWSYCMWECGVALDPAKPDTKIVVFQCGDAVPAPFQDRVRVNAREQTSVQNFAVDFLTKADFFPRYGQAVAPNLNGKSGQVKEAGEELFKRLKKVLPPADPQPVEKWPTVGYVQLSLDLGGVSEIEAVEAKNRQKAAKQVLETSCVVCDSDLVAAQIVGMADLRGGLTFSAMVDAWREGAKDPAKSSKAWVDELTRQIARAACWRFPNAEWTLMRGANHKCYAPLVSWVRRLPAENVMLFDVMFMPIPEAGIPPLDS